MLMTGHGLEVVDFPSPFAKLLLSDIRLCFVCVSYAYLCGGQSLEYKVYFVLMNPKPGHVPTKIFCKDSHAVQQTNS
jgi:hypothetical protein